MSIFPITPLVRRVQSLIIETFDVSEQVAEEYAAEMVALAEGWGSPETAQQLDWLRTVKKRLGDKLRRRSEQERDRFARNRQKGYDAYETYIQRGKRRP